jgi:hypothetical protein
VVIKPDISRCFGLGPETKDGGAHSTFFPGAVTDPRIVRTVIAFLAENKLGSRISIAEGSGEWLARARSNSETDGWSTDWGGAYGGVSYRSIVATFSRRYPAMKFDSVDLNLDGSIELPVPAKTLAHRNSGGTYHVPKTIQQCDKIISIAPLKTHPRMGIGLSMANYLGIAPATKYGFPKTGLDSLGDPDEVVVDLFGYHPADYAVIGGGWILDNEKPVRHNLVIAGVNAVAVDAVGAAVMGFKAGDIRHLKLAHQMGYGDYDLDTIWMRGDDLESARRGRKKG